MSKEINKRMNKKVVFLSLLALVFIALTFFVHWSFIIGAVIIMLINQRELLGKK
jgi:hypothetical protein